MRSTTAILSAAFLALAQGQNIISAKGNSGTSKALQVDLNNPQDINTIKSSEIGSNAVNECGRTLNGNIDIGANTEAALTANQVTQVTKGGKVQIQISQGNGQMSAGPYTCDLDDQSNAKGVTGQIKLTAANANAGNGNANANAGNAKGNGGKGNNRNKGGNANGANGANRANANGGGRFRRQLEVEYQYSSRIGTRANTMTMTVTLPKDLACTGSSQGNVCTIRCINKQEVGSCIAIQQTDTKALPANNQPGNIQTAQTKSGVELQVLQNKQDFSAAAAAIASIPAGSSKDAQDQAQAAAVAKAVVAEQAKNGIVKAVTPNNGGANVGNANNNNANTGNANKNNGGNANAGNANAGKANGNANGNANKNNAGANRGANRGGNANGANGARN